MVDKLSSHCPKVSVVMPVYNSETTVGEAIESILAQTMDDFELIVVDDASTDNSFDVIRRYNDPRILYFRNETNLYVGVTRNRGIDESRGAYVACMDSDDVCYPDRFEKQLQFFKAHPDISICGTFADVFGEQHGRMTMPIDPAHVRCTLLFDTSFAQPTVMFRRADFEKHGLRYDSSRRNMDDLELWQRAVGPLEGANLPYPLLRYRVRTNSLTRGCDLTAQREEYRALDVRMLSRLGIVPSEEDLIVHHMIRKNTEYSYKLDDVEIWLLRIMKANREAKVFPEDALKMSFGRLWFRLCRVAKGSKLLSHTRLFSSPLFTSESVTDALAASIRNRRK